LHILRREKREFSDAEESDMAERLGVTYIRSHRERLGLDVGEAARQDDAWAAPSSRLVEPTAEKFPSTARIF